MTTQKQSSPTDNDLEVKLLRIEGNITSIHHQMNGGLDDVRKKIAQLKRTLSQIETELDQRNGRNNPRRSTSKTSRLG